MEAFIVIVFLIGILALAALAIYKIKTAKKETDCPDCETQKEPECPDCEGKK